MRPKPQNSIEYKSPDVHIPLPLFKWAFPRPSQYSDLGDVLTARSMSIVPADSR